VVKQFNNGTSLLEAARDDAWRVFRVWFKNQPYYPGVGRSVANDVIAELKGYRHPRLFVELYVGPEQGDIAALCDMIEEAVPVVHDAGLRLAAFSWYTGQPEYDIWRYVASRNWCRLNPKRDALSLQEYTNTGTIHDPVNVGRFRLAIQAGWTGPIFITEAGFDSSGTNAGGWRLHLSEDGYYAYLQDYDALVAGEPQVLGATVFTADGMTPDWSNFEFTDPRGAFSAGSSVPDFPIGGRDMAATDLEQRVKALEERDALLTQALNRMLKGEYLGAEGAAADVVALQGGHDDLTGHIRVPSFK
jgi:hypothetical protein